MAFKRPGVRIPLAPPTSRQSAVSDSDAGCNVHPRYDGNWVCRHKFHGLQLGRTGTCNWNNR